MRGSSVLELSSAWVVFRAWGVFCLGLCGASRCGSSEMSHAIPRHVFQTLKSHRWNCNVLGCCAKFGYPNCVRVLVDEAPEASSCVRSSSHDTVHNPRDASNTTPTPRNAKSRICREHTCQIATFTEQNHSVCSQSAFGCAGDPLGDPTAALRGSHHLWPGPPVRNHVEHRVVPHQAVPASRI